MESIVGEDIDGIEIREDSAVKEQLRAEEYAVDGREIGLERVVVVVVELSSLGKEIWARLEQSY